MYDTKALMGSIADRFGDDLRRERDLPADHPIKTLNDAIRRLNALPPRHASNETENRAVIASLVALRDRLRQEAV